ncbi:uncharacterized protein LOC144863300 isoform X2 [Branchiostoma floridae x Branchiostoma japonicum]
MATRRLQKEFTAQSIKVNFSMTQDRKGIHRLARTPATEELGSAPISPKKHRMQHHSESKKKRN